LAWSLHIQTKTQTKTNTKLETEFKSNIEIPRIKIGKRQALETLTSEEALLSAKILKDEPKTWFPRIALETI